MRLTPEQVAFYHRNGFLTFPTLFSPAEIELMLGELPDIFAEDSPRRILERSGAVRTVFAAHQSNPVYGCLTRLRRLVEPAEQLLGSEVYIHQFKINAKVALEGEQWEWHQDFLYWHKEDAMPAPRVLTAAVYLQDVNEFNGPMLIIPGSHREGMVNVGAKDEPARGADGAPAPAWMSTLTADLKYKIDKDILGRLLAQNDIYAVKGQAGLVLFFDGNLFHASSNNLSARDRVTVFVSYNSVRNCLGPVDSPRPDFIAGRDFSPVVAVEDEELCGMRAAV